MIIYGICTPLGSIYLYIENLKTNFDEHKEVLIILGFSMVILLILHMKFLLNNWIKLFVYVTFNAYFLINIIIYFK